MMHRRRKDFSKATKRQALARSRGICECHRVVSLDRPEGCGVRLRSGHCNFEHIDQDALGGGNELSNCAVLVRTCWREKTANVDLPLIAANNRQRDSNWGTQTLPWRPMVGTKRSGVKKRLHPWARPVDRRTGRDL